MVGAAETGSGKTLAFGIPVVESLLRDEELRPRRLRRALREAKEAGLSKAGAQKAAEEAVEWRCLECLVVAPTRELAMQVQRHLAAVTEGTHIRVAALVGGMSLAKQERLLRQRPHIVVGTPGRCAVTRAAATRGPPLGGGWQRPTASFPPTSPRH